MPNDAISREAAKVKEDLLRAILGEALKYGHSAKHRHDGLMWAYNAVANSPIEELSASLPADTRWPDCGFEHNMVAVDESCRLT